MSMPGWPASDAGRAEVTREDMQARDAGITGVPRFILDGDASVPDAAEPGVFLPRVRGVWNRHRRSERTRADGTTAGSAPAQDDVEARDLLSGKVGGRLERNGQARPAGRTPDPAEETVASVLGSALHVHPGDQALKAAARALPSQ